ADELVALELEVDEVPVQPCIEPSRESRGDVGREDRRSEEDGVRLCRRDERFEHVHPRLRERRRELDVLGRVHARRAVAACSARELLRALAEDDADGPAERSRLPEDAEGALLELAARVLEEDERLHRSRLSTT